MNAYAKEGGTAAIQALLENGPLDGNKASLTQANSLRQVEDFYGKYESFDVVTEKSLSPRVHMIFFIMNYSRGMLYGRLMGYKTASGQWVTTDFKFNTEVSELFPPQIFFEKRT